MRAEAKNVNHDRSKWNILSLPTPMGKRREVIACTLLLFKT